MNTDQKSETTSSVNISLDAAAKTFAYELGTLLESGVPLLRSLHIIAERSPSEEFKPIIQAISKAVECERRLSDALAEHPQVFNSWCVEAVRHVEQAKTLGQLFLEVGGKDQFQVLRFSVPNDVQAMFARLGGLLCRTREKLPDGMVRLEAGFEITEALQIVAEEQQGRLKEALIKLRENMIERGRTMSDVMLEFRDVFGDLAISMIDTGEESGELYEMIYRLGGLSVPRYIPSTEMEVGKVYQVSGSMRNRSEDAERIELQINRGAGPRTRALATLEDPNADQGSAALAAMELLDKATREAMLREASQRATGEPTAQGPSDA